MENQPIISHFYKIVLRKKQGHDALQVLLWTDMRFEVRIKWDWYFKYRAALLRVKHPRYHIEEMHGHQPASTRTEAQVLEARIRAKKAKITEYTNKLNQYRANYCELFPIEQDELYARAVSKLARLKFELQQLQPPTLC